MDRSSFWEQFEVSIHKKETFEDVEKLAYLRDALIGKASHSMVIANGRKLCRSH